MKLKVALGIIAITCSLWSCKTDANEDDKNDENLIEMSSENFNYQVEQFADIKLLRYQIPGWESLTLKEQKLVYYLTQAGLSGRCS